MSGLDKNRKRNQTICFRMSPEEKSQMEARIIVTGLPKGKFFIDSVLYQKIGIAVTMRFHMKNPKEEEALQFLQSKSEVLGISQNTFLMKLITDVMEEPVESEFDMDKMTTAIVNGVEKKLLNLVATMTKNADRENEKAEPDIKSEKDKIGLEEAISEDAMDFLNMF